MTEPSTQNTTRRRPERLLSMFAVLALAVLVTGCPTYEDTYSGTFREAVDESDRNSDAVEIDFFRFGDNASAIVRLYKRDPITGDPFGEQQFCAWTTAEPFDEEKSKFRLYLNKSSTQLPRSQLFGTIVDDTRLDITLFDERTGEPHDGIEALPMQRFADEPDPDCQTVEDFIVQVEFPRDPSTGGVQTMPDSAGYDITNPIFAVSWLSVQPVRGSSVYAPVNRHVPALRLDDGFGSNFDPGRHALKNDRPVSIPPPPDIVRMPSGTTTMALGHFVVVDDSEDDRPDEDTPTDWQFSWNTDDEKLVASTLQRATRPECDSGTNRWGRALLFVEDSLLDLSDEMKSQILGLNRCEDDPDSCSGHFHVVDICAEDDRVLDIVLPNQQSGIPYVPMIVTDDYLSADSIPLPRVNPFRPW